MIGNGTQEQSFCRVLSKSLCPEQTTPAWCDKCNKFTPTLQLKRLETLPHVLALNCGMDNQNVSSTPNITTRRAFFDSLNYFLFFFFFQDKDFWQAQMDRLVENVTKQVEPSGGGGVPAAKETNKSNGSHTSKLCRYGEHCTRGNCRFRHPGQEPGIFFFFLFSRKQ